MKRSNSSYNQSFKIAYSLLTFCFYLIKNIAKRTTVVKSRKFRLVTIFLVYKYQHPKFRAQILTKNSISTISTFYFLDQKFRKCYFKLWLKSFQDFWCSLSVVFRFDCLMRWSDLYHADQIHYLTQYWLNRSLAMANSAHFPYFQRKKKWQTKM